MRTSINDSLRAVQIWCSKEERENDIFLNQMKELAAINKELKYRTVLYVCGDESLGDITSQMLHQHVRVSPV